MGRGERGREAGGALRRFFESLGLVGRGDELSFVGELLCICAQQGDSTSLYREGGGEGAGCLLHPPWRKDNWPLLSCTNLRQEFFKKQTLVVLVRRNRHNGKNPEENKEQSAGRKEEEEENSGVPVFWVQCGTCADRATALDERVSGGASGENLARAAPRGICGGAGFSGEFQRLRICVGRRHVLGHVPELLGTGHAKIRGGSRSKGGNYGEGVSNGAARGPGLQGGVVMLVFARNGLMCRFGQL